MSIEVVFTHVCDRCQNGFAEERYTLAFGQQIPFPETRWMQYGHTLCPVCQSTVEPEMKRLFSRPLQ